MTNALVLKEECERQHARAEAAEKQRAALVAAIRALPRHSAFQISDRYTRWEGADDYFVKVSDLARLLGDPAQEQP